MLGFTLPQGFEVSADPLSIGFLVKDVFALYNFAVGRYLVDQSLALFGGLCGD